MLDHHTKIKPLKDHIGPAKRHWIRREALRGRFSHDRLIEHRMDTGFKPSNNIYPSLFHSWPMRAGRIDKTMQALARVERRRKFDLPTRKEYQSTVDLYEAALPVIKALKRLDEHPKTIAPVPSLSIRGMLKNLKEHLYFSS